MKTGFYKFTGKIIFIIFPVLFLLSSCSISSSDVKYDRAVALRALEAARAKGAEYSTCASQNFYQADIALKSGERFILSANDQAKADGYYKQSAQYSEKAEEEAVFCAK